MTQHQKRLFGESIISSITRLMRFTRVFLREKMNISSVRAVTLMSMCALLGSMAATHGVSNAFAMQLQPHTTWSFYIYSASTTEAYTLGCNQGKYDASFSPHVNSEVILDFGGQFGGKNLLLSGLYVTDAQIQAVAEAFSNGYWICTGNNDPTSVLTLAIGTNNYDNGHVGYATGQTWANDVIAVQTSNKSKGYTSQIGIMGADDMEPSWNSVSATKAWTNGFSSIAGSTYKYLDFGSADGCPTSSSNNGSCNNGWKQYDEWYFSWGEQSALPTPEIYVPVQALQWTMISQYGQQYQSGRKVIMQGPLDEYDLDNTTLTTSQAWNDLWTDLNNNSSTQQTMTYSLEIHDE